MSAVSTLQETWTGAKTSSSTQLPAAPKPHSGTQPPPLNWTRFKRLLRPLETSLAGLSRLQRHGSSIETQSQQPRRVRGSGQSKCGSAKRSSSDLESSQTDLHDPDWNPDIPFREVRKPKRKTYQRKSHASRPFAARALDKVSWTSLDDELACRQLLIRRSSILSTRLDSESKQSSLDASLLLALSQALLTRAKKRNPEAALLYERIHQQIKAILFSTEKHDSDSSFLSHRGSDSRPTRKTNVPKLLSICVRQLPNCCQAEEEWNELQREENGIPDSVIDAPPTAREEIYKSLEQYGIVRSDGGWTQFRDLLRAQAAFDLEGTITKNLVPGQLAHSWILLFQAFCAPAEAQRIAASALNRLESTIALPPHRELWNSWATTSETEQSVALYPFCLLDAFWRLDHSARAMQDRIFTYRLLAKILQSGRMSGEWFALRQIQQVIETAAIDLRLRETCFAAAELIYAASKAVDCSSQLEHPDIVGNLRTLEYNARSNTLAKRDTQENAKVLTLSNRGPRGLTLLESIVRDTAGYLAERPNLDTPTSSNVDSGTSTPGNSRNNIFQLTDQEHINNSSQSLIRAIAEDALGSSTACRLSPSLKGSAQKLGLRIGTYRLQCITAYLLIQDKIQTPQSIGLAFQHLKELSSLSDRHMSLLINPAGFLEDEASSISRFAEFLWSCIISRNPNSENPYAEAFPRGSEGRRSRVLFEQLIRQLDCLIPSSWMKGSTFELFGRVIMEAAHTIAERLRDSAAESGTQRQIWAFQAGESWAQEVEHAIVSKLKQARTSVVGMKRKAAEDATPARRAWTWEAGLNEYIMKTPFDQSRIGVNMDKRTKLDLRDSSDSRQTHRSHSQPNLHDTTRPGRNGFGFHILVPTRNILVHPDSPGVQRQGAGEVSSEPCSPTLANHELENDTSRRSWHVFSPSWLLMGQTSGRSQSCVSDRNRKTAGRPASDGKRIMKDRCQRSAGWLGDDELNSL